MQVARVKGSVVSTDKAEQLNNFKLLVIKPIDLRTFEESGAMMVAVDVVGAGEDEVVLVVGGSPARQTARTDMKPVDQTIVGIIDNVDIAGSRVFTK